LHIDLQRSFLYTGAPWLFATATDLFIGGMLVDALVSRGWNAPLVRKVVLVGGTACGLGILGAAHAHTAAQALAWIGLSIGGLSAAAPVGWSIPALITPRPSVGKVGGIVNFVCQVSGITAEIANGYIVRATHSYALAFDISAIYLLLGIAGYLFLLGRIEPIKTAHLPAA
jgi:MFS transporter, ACS family, D-galactonate transporter